MFNERESHSRHNMKINNPFKVLSRGSALKINRKQKYYKGLIFTVNRHKQLGERL